MSKSALFALCLIAFVVKGQGQCPPPFISIYDDPAETSAPSCYLFDVILGTYLEHSAACANQGLKLAEPISLNAQRQLREHILSDTNLNGKGFFLGATDSAMEDTWVWNSGEPVYTYWSQDPHPEPDGGTSQNCICLFRDDYLMHSCACGYRTYAICQL